MQALAVPVPQNLQEAEQSNRKGSRIATEALEGEPPDGGF